MESNESEFTDFHSITMDQSSEVITIVSGEEITPKKRRRKYSSESVTYSEEEHKNSKEVAARKKRQHKKDIRSEEEEEEEYDSWSADEDNESFGCGKIAIFIVALLVLFAIVLMLVTNKSNTQTQQNCTILTICRIWNQTNQESDVIDTKLESNIMNEAKKDFEKKNDDSELTIENIDMTTSNENMENKAGDKNNKGNSNISKDHEDVIKTNDSLKCQAAKVKHYIHINSTKKLEDIIKNFHGTGISEEKITVWFQEVKKKN
jgi:hypothetical protein